jgi:hypothetical protein
MSHWKAYAAWEERAPGLDPWGIWSASLRSKLVAIRARIDRDLASGLSPLIDEKTELHSRRKLWQKEAAELDTRIEQILVKIPWAGVVALSPQLAREVQTALRAAARFEHSTRKLMQLTLNLDLGGSG